MTALVNEYQHYVRNLRIATDNGNRAEEDELLDKLEAIWDRATPVERAQIQWAVMG